MYRERERERLIIYVCLVSGSALRQEGPGESGRWQKEGSTAFEESGYAQSPY